MQYKDANDLIKDFTETCLKALKQINDNLDEIENKLNAEIASMASEIPDSGYHPIKKSYIEDVNNAEKALKKISAIDANDDWQYSK